MTNFINANNITEPGQYLIIEDMDSWQAGGHFRFAVKINDSFTTEDWQQIEADYETEGGTVFASHIEKFSQ